MTLITVLLAIASVTAGFLLGLVYAGRANADPSRIQELEERLGEMKAEQEQYRDNVSEHFGTAAELMRQMTDNYRDVYRHLANGARDLCSPEVAGKLPPPDDGTVFESVADEQDGDESGTSISQPRDYATRHGPGQKGALSEEFGIASDVHRLKTGDDAD